MCAYFYAELGLTLNNICSPSFLSRSRGTKTSRAAFATSNNHWNIDRTFKQCAGVQTVTRECRYNTNHLAHLLKDCLKVGARRHLNRTSQCNIAKSTIRLTEEMARREDSEVDLRS